MGFFGNLLGWLNPFKRKESKGLPPLEPSADLGTPQQGGTQDWSSPGYQPSQQAVIPPAHAFPPQSVEREISSKDMQILISKLDLINARLENLNQRLSSLEQTLSFEKKYRY